MSILVVGATGQTGQQIVKKLRAQSMALRVLARSRARACEVFGDGTAVVEGDVLKTDSLGPAMNGVETIFCATGTRTGFGANGAQQVDYEGTRNLVYAARRAGVGRLILVSSLCVSRLIHPLNLFGGVLFWKKRAEDYLLDSGLNFTIVRPGGLRDGAGGAEIVVRPADTLFEGTIDRADVARVCVEALGSVESEYKIVEIISGPAAAQPSLAPLFAALPAAGSRLRAS
ncbi:SDR family oxidoreductase [Gloeobacter morelensis]|uniref:SDR family oxidoreductase n=1 Tax=Gloeobacter morelensis MG652769 TaxID=2781736 RepID=A0ABY3PS05_9CYAN|nr:SDR family oxidoreductase [Gloeobacter morelensis]UFP96415.1 SDR family oxidoreductase [Gloeobacter morelensis MG652769]